MGLIIEGKKEEVAKRLKDRWKNDGPFIDKVLNIDPTGYKYVEFIEKSLNNIIDKLTDSKGGLYSTQTEAIENNLSNLINWFHYNSDRITDDSLSSAKEIYTFTNKVHDVPNFNKILKAPKDITHYTPEFLNVLQTVVENQKKIKKQEKEEKSKVNKLFEDDTLLIIEPLSHGASCYYGRNSRWCVASRDNSSTFIDYKNRGKLIYFINKKTGNKIAVYKSKVDGKKTYFKSDDSQTNLKFLKDSFPNHEEVIDEALGVGSLYKVLRDFARGKVSAHDLENADNTINSIDEKEPRGQSKVVIDFDTNEEYFNFLGLSDDDSWFFNVVNNPYDTYRFNDSYLIEQDFKDGYAFSIFEHADNENMEKLKKIVSIIMPGVEFNFDDDNFRRELSIKLLELFPNEMDYIISDYASEKDYEMNKTAQTEIESEIDEYLENLGFKTDSRYHNRISTTVGNLIMWYVKLGAEKNDLSTLIHKISEQPYKDLGGWSDNQWEFQNDENFDDVSYNRTLSRNFDKILDSFEDEDVEGTIPQFLDLIKKIKSKFKIDTWYSVPKDENVIFRIKGFDRNGLKIKVDIRKKDNLKLHSISLSEEGFNKFLYQMELFDYFD